MSCSLDSVSPIEPVTSRVIFPGGEAQRVALAVSMANEPSLLLADEVVAQLDGETAGHVIDEVLEADFAVLFVTHDVALADLAEHRFELVDRQVMLR